jgi:hypothetical protein
VAGSGARTARHCAPLELAQQPRLAHAGLAGDEDCARLATLGPLERSLERRHLIGAADEVRTGNPSCHMPIIAGRRRLVGEKRHASRRRRASVVRRDGPVERTRPGRTRLRKRPAVRMSSALCACVAS